METSGVYLPGKYPEGVDKLKYYRRQAYRFGDLVQVYIYPVKESGKIGKGSRGKRRKPSRECQRALNASRRAERLKMEIPYNFGAGDLFITLTYDDEHNPESYERAAKDFKNYLAKLQRVRAREGLPPLRCIWVTEQGSRSGRWHHHAIISGGLPWEIYDNKWGGGYVKIDPLRETPTSYKHLAKYIAKPFDDEQPGGDHLTGGRVHRTRNIQTPPALENDFEVSRRKAAKIAGEVVQGVELGDLLPMLAGYIVQDAGAFYNELDGDYYIKIYAKNYQKNAKKFKAREEVKRCTGTAKRQNRG